MHITMVGTGYVGLVSGVCFADYGHNVTCVDTDFSKIQNLNQGIVPIYEPGLEDLVQRNVKAGRLHFTTELKEAMTACDALFIAVGTPSRRGDGHADLSFVYDAARDIAPFLKDGSIIVTKSTVPVGTGDKIYEIIHSLRPDISFSVVSNPEFLREGAAIEDFKRPDRIVIGIEDAHAKTVMSEIYRPLFLNQAPILFVDRRTAELTKYAANAFLATKITFINEMADLCEKVGANVQDVARGIGLDNRIGSKFLHAGPGFGGSCFPKDTLALLKTSQDYDAPSRIVEVVISVNEQRKKAMGRKIVHACGGSVHGKTIALLGLAFKPNTDDMRDAPSLAIIQTLQDKGANVIAYDPEARTQAEQIFHNITFADDPYHCIQGADALVIITEWEMFRALDLKRIKTLLRQPAIIDLRNIYRPEEMKELGFDYTSIGRS